MLTIIECRAKAREALECAALSTNWQTKADCWEMAIDWMLLGDAAEAQDGLQLLLSDPDLS